MESVLKCSESQSGFIFLFVNSESGLDNWRSVEAEQTFFRCCDCITNWFLDYKIEICNNFHGSVAAESISLMELEL